jgi:hypothetical protein
MLGKHSLTSYKIALVIKCYQVGMCQGGEAEEEDPDYTHWLKAKNIGAHIMRPLRKQHLVLRIWIEAL